MSNEITPQEQPTEQPTRMDVDVIWVVSHVLAIISLLEDKFGVHAIDELAKLATYLDENMRKEEANQ